MRPQQLAPFGACILAAAGALHAAPGLTSRSGGLALERSTPHLYLASGEGFTPHSAVEDIELTGRLMVARAGEHRFFHAVGTLRIDGHEVGPEAVHLEAGRHRFDFRLKRRNGPLHVSLEWAGPGFAREPIPPHFFSHEAEEPRALDGRALFEEFGCSNCHLSDSLSIARQQAPVLTGLGGRVKPSWIRHWLNAPERFRPWATMPTMLSARERGHVAAFLASLGAESIDEPNFGEHHSRRGRTNFQSLGCTACHTGELSLVGLGSKMTVGRLRDFLRDPLKIAPAGRMPSFHLSADEALDLAAFLALSTNESFELPVAGGDIDQGRKLVQTAGCLACHSLEGVPSAHVAPELTSLRSKHGCLGDSPATRVPRYSLSASQRDALRGFIDGYQRAPDTVAAPIFDLRRRLQQLRCHGCHEIDGQPATGVVAETAPPLTDVGRKLKASWIERVISSEQITLDWQQLRMPSYGSSHAAWLASTLAKSAGVDPQEAPLTVRAGDREKGHDMLGVDAERSGMGCIGCHGWGEFPSLGENGPNLAEAGRRLRPQWFERWMRQPARILEGTSMPSYFADSSNPENALAVANLWAAFQSAADLPLPFGFQLTDASVGGETRPVPVDRAVVIRWDMPEASPAAIAVGLPGGVSYCFDAGESRLRYVWRGGFVDMARTLLSKKNRETNLTETAEIIGDIFFREGPAPIRTGDRERIPQKRFRGYRLVDTLPEFHYQLDGVDVYELIAPMEGGIVRHFRIAEVSQPMWFVPSLAAGVSIQSSLRDNQIPRGVDVQFEVTVVAQ